MSYSFRIRVNRSPTDTIQCDEREIIISSHNEKIQVTLRNSRSDQSIKDAEQLVLHGDGYDSAQEAIDAGELHQEALVVALARVRVGADFGQRAAKGGYTDDGLKWLEQEYGQRSLNNVHGLMAYQTDPKPLFGSFNGAGIRGVNPENFQKIFLQSLIAQPRLTEREQLAFTLFNASFFQPSVDSRFFFWL